METIAIISLVARLIALAFAVFTVSYLINARKDGGYSRDPIMREHIKSRRVVVAKDTGSSSMFQRFCRKVVRKIRRR